MDKLLRTNAVIYVFFMVALFAATALAATGGGYTTAPSTTPSDGGSGSTAFVCGDADGDGTVDISDAVFLGAHLANKGPAPTPLVAADANRDAVVDMADMTYLVNHIFSGGPEPLCPAYKSCADYNADGILNNLDPMTVINYIFSGGALASGSDINNDGAINVADATAIAAYIAGPGYPPICGSRAYFACADPTNDKKLDWADVDRMIRGIFGNQPIADPTTADANGDGLFNISDAVKLTGYLTGEGSAPTCATSVPIPSGPYCKGLNCGSTTSAAKPSAGAL